MSSVTFIQRVGLTFARFGYQGSAQAQNLRDSGISNEQVLIVGRVDSYANTVREKGFTVVRDFSKAAEVTDGPVLNTGHDSLIRCNLLYSTIDFIQR